MINKSKMSQQQKPIIKSDLIKEIQWFNNTKGPGLYVGRYKEYIVLSKNKTHGPMLVYDHQEWKAFLSGVQNGEFDNFNNK